jgi:hypothetical protein
MDDFAAGAEDSNGLITIYYQLTSLTLKISLPMGKWASNSEPLRKIWRISGLEIKKYIPGLMSDLGHRTGYPLRGSRDVTDKAQENFFRQPQDFMTPWV